MNKFQKSLDRIKKNVPLNEDSWTDEDKEHIITIMEALEKQIPIKPVEKFPFEVCPRCDKGVHKGMKYCTECGIALDWSDTE